MKGMAIIYKELKKCLNFNAVSRKGAGSNPDNVIGFFNLPKPSSRITALGLTQPLTQMSTRRSFWLVERCRRVADILIAIREPIV
jgi:hypothetical protein